jgi:RHS repeat-associated protein
VVTKYYYLGNTRVAMRKADTLYYLLGDHLGSTTLTYNATSGERKRQLYLPYGAARRPSPSTLPTDYRFTGQRAESGLGAVYDYGARFYDGALGRFLSPDSIVPRPGRSTESQSVRVCAK